LEREGIIKGTEEGTNRRCPRGELEEERFLGRERKQSRKRDS